MGALVKNTGFSSLPSLFDEFFGRDWFNWTTFNNSATGTTLPAVNIKESNDEFEIEVAVPGMKKEDFNVELDNNMLIISSEKEEKHEEKDDNGNYTRREFSYQSFRRSFTLPENTVDADKIKAKYTDGILKITLPKKEEAKVKPAKKISIK